MPDEPESPEPDVAYRSPSESFREIARREIAKARRALEKAEVALRPFAGDDDATPS